jgi:hypothetical protein
LRPLGWSSKNPAITPMLPTIRAPGREHLVRLRAEPERSRRHQRVGVRHDGLLIARRADLVRELGDARHRASWAVDVQQDRRHLVVRERRLQVVADVL